MFKRAPFPLPNTKLLHEVYNMSFTLLYSVLVLNRNALSFLRPTI